jgi:hypothetical protein
VDHCRYGTRDFAPIENLSWRHARFWMRIRGRRGQFSHCARSVRNPPLWVLAVYCHFSAHANGDFMATEIGNAANSEQRLGAFFS